MISELSNPERTSFERSCNNLRSYAVTAIPREFQRRQNTKVRPGSRSSSITDQKGIEVGPISQQHLSCSTACSFSALKEIFFELHQSLKHQPSNGLLLYPLKLLKLVSQRVHSKFSIGCSSFLTFCLAISISKDEIRKALLWNERDGALRIQEHSYRN